ncbi:CDP-alcohol phosphatidyltransferase family protein [Leifsonia kafniensis]|uniref:CDP-alcohol phosphatidyltransferase family protein n=1 Tax=Leifsonia kafniensis TaxID=475957 RepID=A0ABP7KW24_9MICO
MNSFTQALAELSSAQKSRRGVSLYSRFVNRPAGRMLAAAANTLRMTPNGVTAVSALVTGVGIAILVSGTPTPARAVTVTFLLMLGFALDSADGQLARLTGRGSAAGEWADHVVDSAKIVAIHAAVLVVAFRFLAVDPLWYLVPIGFQLVAIVTFVGGLLTELLTRSARSERPVDDKPSPIRSMVLLPADYGILAVSFVVLGWPDVFLVTYSLLFAANALIMLMLLVKWFRTLSSVR